MGVYISICVFVSCEAMDMCLDIDAGLGGKIIWNTSSCSCCRFPLTTPIFVQGKHKMIHDLALISLQYWAIGLMSRVFVNSPGDRGSIPGRFIPKT